MSEPILYETAFTISALHTAKYERVSRLTATNHEQDTSLTLDVNTELYPLHVGDRVQIALALTLSLDGPSSSLSKEAERGRGWRDTGTGTGGGGERSLADEYDYVCYGKIYRFEEGTGDDVRVFVSFGGLLLYIEGPYTKLSPLRIDYVYLLMKR